MSLLDLLRDDKRNITELGISNSGSTEPIVRSRRSLIAGSLSALLLTWLGVSSVDYLRHRNDPINPDIYVDERVYTSGDVVNTLLGGVKIDGWKIAFKEDDAKAALSRGIDFRLMATCNFGTNHGYIEGVLQKNQGIFIEDLLEREDFSKKKIIPTINWTVDSNHYYFNLLPHIGETQIVLELTTVDSKLKKSHIYRYKIEPKVFRYDPSSSDDFVRVISESRIDQAKLRPVHEIHKLLAQYREPGGVYVVNEDPEKIRGIKVLSTEFAETQLLTNRNIMTVNGIEIPFFDKQAEAGACHEIAHYLFNYRTVYHELGLMDIELSSKILFSMYFDIMKHKNKWQLFESLTESTYFGKSKHGISSNAGHPYDKPSELFASTVCVLRYFAKDFLDKYRHFDESTKTLARNVCESTFNVLLSINPSRELLNKVLPDLGEILRTIRS